jgi:7-cyano-7-deazaguanine synthase
MLSLAAALAIDAKYTKVALGIHTGDHFIYPDCREEFFEHLKKATILGNEGRISNEFDILAPFLKKDKTDIAELAILLGVPLNETYSDYEGGEVQRACSGTSVERIEAISLAYARIEELEKPFKQSHLKDSTEYKDKEFALDLLIARAKNKRLIEIL